MYHFDTILCMKKHVSTILAVALILVLPASAFADAGWPTLLIAVSPIIMWYIGIASILVEAAVLWHSLQISLGKALHISLVANITSLIVGILLGGIGIGYLGGVYGQTSVLTSPIANAVFGTWHGSLLIMLILTIGIEIGIIKVIWKYDWRQLRPVIVMNILSYLIIEMQFLKDNLVF